MRRHNLRRAMTLAAAGVLALSVTTAVVPANAAPPAGPTVLDFQAEQSANRDIDNRGTVQPSDKQRSLAGTNSTSVRWNRFGTPAMITPKADTQRKAAA